MRNRADFQRWISDKVASLAPGSRLPTDRQLAETAGLSVRTVVSVMQQLQRENAVVRIRGNGTFTAGATPPDELPVSRSSAVQDVAAFLYESVCCGELRRGEAFPSVKYLSKRLRVSPSTVTSAYRLLAKRLDVVRVGKTWWHGDYESMKNDRPHKQVYVFLDDEADRARVFRNPTYGAAYHTMEEVLSTGGYLVRYDSAGHLRRLCRLWDRTGYPYGLVFCNMDTKRMERVDPSLRSIARQDSRHGCTVVFDWRSGDFTKALSLGRVVYRLGRTGTAFLAQYLVSAGYPGATFFIDAGYIVDNNYRFWVFWDFLHLRAELLRLNPTFDWRLTVLDPSGTFTWETHPYRFTPQSIMRVAGVYAPVTREEIFARIRIETDIERAFDMSRDQAIWVFQKDRDASVAVDWALRHRVAVPQQLSLLSVDNDPEYYHLGLSRCEIDWEGIGYLMAHAIMRDFEMPVTEEGVLRVRARVVEKLTTKR